MKAFRSVSRGIFIALTCFASLPVMAQGRFDVDDVSAFTGYRGYSTYRNQVAEARNDVAEDRFAPQPILNQQFIQQSPTMDNGDQDFNSVQKELEASRIEEFYRERTGDKELNQFGYDLFYTAKIKSKDDNDYMSAPAGAVQGNYILQAGDEINVIFTGERRDQKTYLVTSDGRLIVDGFNPINVMGRTLAQLKNDITSMKQNMQYRGDIDVSVSAIRQIGVLVAGHVYKPGRQNLNAFHSVLDALNMAGGIRKSGSLRSIKLIRNGSTYPIDLYDYIAFQNPSRDMVLQDGDRIVVAPLGPTFAVTGDVKQTGVFELKSNFGRAQPVNMMTALKLAGGVLGAGQTQFSVMQGDGQIINLSKQSKAVIQDGSILNVTRATDRLSNAIEVKGYSRQNGFYDLDSAGTLTQLMGDRRLFGDDTYPLMGMIARVQRESLTKKLMGFSPQAVALGQDDRQLEVGDVVYLFSNDDIQSIVNFNNESNEQNKYPNVINDFIIDQGVSLQGAVRSAGIWPVGTVTDLQTLVSVAGGLTAKASRSDIEITSRNTELGNTHRRRKIDAKDIRLVDVMLEAGDQVRVNERYEQAVEKTVRVSGEVKNPGNYDLMRGDTLLSVIERAGGLTPDAYPPAAVFSRKAERKREEQKFRAAAQELERTVSVNLNATDKNASLTPAQISMARQLADDLRSVQAIGRVTVEADPTVLGERPELNMLVEDGDHLHIPKRVLNVRVSGEVMNPASLLFHDTKDVDDYIKGAGGTSYFADKGRMFVVYPDGSAQPIDSGWSSMKQAMIIPGSTIIVPRDPKPFNFMDSFKDITQILTNMAITGVFIEDIANDEN